MDEFFRGYVETKDKKCIEKFKNRTDFKTYEQVEKLNEFAGVLSEDAILIDVDDYEQSEKLLQIVEDLELACRVYETSKGKHFLFKNDGIESCKTHSDKWMTAVGFNCVDYKVGSKNSYSVLKHDGKLRKIIYDRLEGEEYASVPKWLFPVNRFIDFPNMGDEDGRNQTLFNYILTLQSDNFSIEETRQCIRIINKYVLKNPLDDSELETILRDEAFETPVFFVGKSFLFDKFAKFMISRHHIIKINNQLHLYRDGVYVGNDGDIEAEMIGHISGLNQNKRREVMSYLNVYIRDNTPVADANYIAFRNGIYNVEMDELIDFSPDIVVTNKIEYDYNPSAYSEIADKTLTKLACEDDSVRKLLEEAIGYCFYRRNELRKSFILIGDKSNGKSTYLDMIRTLLGSKNIASLDLKELGERFKTSQLAGKLANIGDDIGDEFIGNPAIFKKIVSGDRLNVENKGADPFEFDNYSKMLFSANNIPRIKDKSGAVLSRLIIVPFDAKISADDPDFDPYIKYKLRKPEVMEYLIQIGIQGLKRVLENAKFTSSKKVQKELEDYEESNNPILMFFKEIEEVEMENEPTKNVYKRYNEFCLANSFTPLSNIEFSKQVKKYYGFEIIDKTIKGKKYRIFVKK